MNFLDRIIAVKQKEVEDAKVRLPQDRVVKMLKSLSADGSLGCHSAEKRDFAAAVNIADKISLIAEIKKSSPSKGVLRQDFDPIGIARDYQSAGAAALSVLTDEQFFGGRNDFVGKIKGVTRLPVLRKDFIIDEYQIYQSALIEVDCILLIAEILDKKRIENFLLTASLLNVEVLIESNTQEALDKAIDSGAKLVGINNRNLNTFEVDIKTTQRLIEQIPTDRIVVSESGIKTKEDVEFLKSLGVDAVLIGEAFMQADDIARKVKEIMGWQ